MVPFKTYLPRASTVLITLTSSALALCVFLEVRSWHMQDEFGYSPNQTASGTQWRLIAFSFGGDLEIIFELRRVNYLSNLEWLPGFSLNSSVEDYDDLTRWSKHARVLAKQGNLLPTAAFTLNRCPTVERHADGHVRTLDTYTFRANYVWSAILLCGILGMIVLFRYRHRKLLKDIARGFPPQNAKGNAGESEGWDAKGAVQN